MKRQNATYVLVLSIFISVLIQSKQAHSQIYKCICHGKTIYTDGVCPCDQGDEEEDPALTVSRDKLDEAMACYTLAARYYEGEGIKKNYRKALKWWRVACDSGKPDACYRAGELCREKQLPECNDF